MAMCVGGCVKYQRATNATICENVHFDYADEGVNDTNARGLLLFYCLCEDNKACEK